MSHDHPQNVLAITQRCQLTSQGVAFTVFKLLRIINIGGCPFHDSKESFLDSPLCYVGFRQAKLSGRSAQRAMQAIAKKREDCKLQYLLSRSVRNSRAAARYPAQAREC